MPAVADEPADRYVHLRFAHQLVVANDPRQKAREHEQNRHLGIDARAAVTAAVAVGNLLRQPGEIEDPIHSDEDIFVRDELPQLSSCDQLQLATFLPSKYRASLAIYGSPPNKKNPNTKGFSMPLVHNLRNLLNKVPEDVWPELKARAAACYQAASPALAR